MKKGRGKAKRRREEARGRERGMRQGGENERGGKGKRKTEEAS